MNRAVKYIVYIVFLIVAMTSCNKEKKNSTSIVIGYESDYGELAEKYAEMEFSNCEEAIAAGNEIASVFFSTSDLAFKEKDAKAISDLEHFEELFELYDNALEPLYTKCPEEIDKWNKENKQKIEAIMHKLNTMVNKHDNDSICSEDISSEIEAVNKRVEQLKIDIQHFNEEDDSLNNPNDA